LLFLTGKYYGAMSMTIKSMLDIKTVFFILA